MSGFRSLSILCLCVFSASSLFAQPDSLLKKDTIIQQKWYDAISVRGYIQVRYNRLLETNPLLKNEQGDKSWGENGGFFLRRMRLIFSGQISKRVYFYLQPDFASSVSSGNLHFGQLRDAYVDLGFDKKNEFRIRIGQSKIPYGFENMQSSQNRLPLDRADGTNSAMANERDLGAFFYWAPDRVRKQYAMLVKAGLKGSGDYGVVGFGAFNGQTANKPEANNNRHWVGRISYPFNSGKQIFETSLQGYSGKYKLEEAQMSSGVKVNSTRNYTDQRLAGTFVLYPQPFGIQAEYNIGRGPAFNKQTDSVELSKLSGGYITLSYLNRISKQLIIPFARAHYYNGGKKHELDARKYHIRELEIGVEWQPVPQFELVCHYTMSRRRFEDYVLQDNLQSGRLLRIQAQVNF